MTTTLLFVRHAEVHNPLDVFYGRLPRFRLTARGREQAARVADCLADVPLAAIYTSPMLRARQTAAVIATRHPGLPVRRSALINEIHTGWQGTLSKDIPKGTSFYVTRHSPHDEGIAEVLARMQRMVRLVLRRHPGRVVVCVSHADPIAILTLWAGGEEVTPALLQQPLAPARGAVTVFEYRSPDEPPVLSYFNPQDPEPEKPPEPEATLTAEVAASRDGTAAASPVREASDAPTAPAPSAVSHR